MRKRLTETACCSIMLLHGYCGCSEPRGFKRSAPANETELLRAARAIVASHPWPANLAERRELLYGALDDCDGGDVALGARAGMLLQAVSEHYLGAIDYQTQLEVLAAFDRAIVKGTCLP